MINAVHLSFSYGRKAVLRDVSFSLPDGSLTAVLGKNGAGKSTLFRCILGLLRPYGGSVTVTGQEVRTLTAPQIAHRVAYIPQTHYPAFNYSVFDMVLMGTTHHTGAFSSPGAEQRHIANEAMRDMGILDLRDRGYATLSGGEQQLTLIARAIAQQVPAFLMDEPTASLDYGNQHRVLSKVRELAERGYTVLLSSHNPQHVLSYAHRMVALQDGCVLAEGSPRDVMDASLLRTLYGVEVSLTEVSGQRLIVMGGIR